MTEHKLDAGKQIIEGLFNLGESLGYVVEKELPVERNRKNPPALDVAWLSEKGQEFPLMIFEVESKVTNAIANNPAKVFGKSNQSFEKPLFFFHVMVSGGQDTSRVDDLRRLFGSHNYRAYELASGKTTELVKDILGQHRRLTRKIDLIGVIKVLESQLWKDANLSEVIQHIENIGFERGHGTFLPRYAALSRNKPEFRQHFIRYLIARESALPYIEEDDRYESWIGSWWAAPIHLGILVLSSDEIQRKKFFYEKLINWQKDTLYGTKIGPHLGLDSDYTQAILGCAPPYWALIAVLMHDLPEAVKFIAEQCKLILLKIESGPLKYSFFTAMWLLHISASSELSLECFEYARNFINNNGGIPDDLLYYPKGYLELEVEDRNNDWLLSSGSEFRPTPDIDEFKSKLAIAHSKSASFQVDAVLLAQEVLLDHGMPLEWSPKLTQLLQG